MQTQVLQANAVGHGAGLRFESPALATVKPEALLVTERFKPITVQSLRDRGARWYC